MAQPKYLTGDNAAIDTFLDQFDVGISHFVSITFFLFRRIVAYLQLGLLVRL